MMTAKAGKAAVAEVAGKAAKAAMTLMKAQHHLNLSREMLDCFHSVLPGSCDPSLLPADSSAMAASEKTAQMEQSLLWTFEIVVAMAAAAVVVVRVVAVVQRALETGQEVMDPLESEPWLPMPDSTMLLPRWLLVMAFLRQCCHRVDVRGRHTALCLSSSTLRYGSRGTSDDHRLLHRPHRLTPPSRLGRV